MNKIEAISIDNIQERGAKGEEFVYWLLKKEYLYIVQEPYLYYHKWNFLSHIVDHFDVSGPFSFIYPICLLLVYLNQRNFLSRTLIKPDIVIFYRLYQYMLYQIGRVLPWVSWFHPYPVYFIEIKTCHISVGLNGIKNYTRLYIKKMRHYLLMKPHIRIFLCIVANCLAADIQGLSSRQIVVVTPENLLITMKRYI